MSTVTATATWIFNGMSKGRATCDHCGRRITRLFAVTTPDGRALTLGIDHARAVIGDGWTSMRSLEDVEAQAKYGKLWVDLTAARDAHCALTGMGGPAAEGMRVLRDAPTYLTEGERVAFAQDALRIARE